MIQDIDSNHFSDTEGRPAGGTTTAVGLKIIWQNGPLGRGENRLEPNGCFVETVINAAVDRLRYYQESGFKCDQNAHAISRLEEALAYLRDRTAQREAAGIEGAHEKS